MSAVIESVISSFGALVAEKPYKSITVKEICEGAFISRRTFYTNFVDKRAIIAYILRRDAVVPASRAVELLGPDELKEIAPLVLSRFYQGIFDNRTFYMNLVKPMAGVDPTFELVAARAVSGTLTKLVKRLNPQVDEKALTGTVYYHAAGGAIFLERWIYDGCTVPVDDIGKLLARIIVPSFESLMPGRLL